MKVCLRHKVDVFRYFFKFFFFILIHVMMHTIRICIYWHPEEPIYYAAVI